MSEHERGSGASGKGGGSRPAPSGPKAKAVEGESLAEMEVQPTSRSELKAAARFEEEPLTRPEYLSVMVHFYRAEVQRSTIWRTRLDATTNWAALTAAGMLSWAFSDPGHTHVMLLLTNLIVLVYLLMEARRYRRFEVYWARVRMLEENFISPVVSRELESPMNLWRDDIAKDLNRPTYKSNLAQAIGFRLRRNYAFIFAILLGAWFVKLGLHPTVAESWAMVWARVGVGCSVSAGPAPCYIPPWLVAAVGAGFYAALLSVAWLGRDIHGTGPVDEVTGVEQHPERWKF